MITKLTQEQINYLFSFCAEQGIIHYDVQVEMVDHFTEWIETNWEKQPGANFMNMITLAKEAFPEQELKEIVNEKEKLLKKGLIRLYKDELISFFSLPKIVLSILLFVIFYSIPWDPEKDIFQEFTTFILIVNIYTIYLVLWEGKNIIVRNKDEKIFPLLMYEKLEWLMKGQLITSLAIFVLVLPSFFTNIKTTNLYLIYTIKTILPFMIIVTVSFIHVQVKINKKIRALYPTAFANS